MARKLLILASREPIPDRLLVVFGALWGAGYLAWKQDPNMLSILKASTRFKSRYDPGKWIAEPWRVIVKGRHE